MEKIEASFLLIRMAHFTFQVHSHIPRHTIHSIMPGVTARSSTKNMSRSKRAAVAKNTRRVDAAINSQLELCTYGKITKALGNKTFIVLNTEKREHKCHIRGKMSRIEAGDVVLLNIRDYESRTGSTDEIYDIMAVFSSKEVNRLIKMSQIPVWMSGKTNDSESDHDIFEYDEGEDEDIEVDTKNSHRVFKTIIDFDEVDIDTI